MGFMFGMIIADLLYLTFLIIGLFGVYQYRVNYVAVVIKLIFFVILYVWAKIFLYPKVVVFESKLGFGCIILLMGLNDYEFVCLKNKLIAALIEYDQTGLMPYRTQILSISRCEP